MQIKIISRKVFSATVLCCSILISSFFSSCLKQTPDGTISQVSVQGKGSGILTGKVFYQKIYTTADSPIIGATVSIDGTNISALTDSNGVYTLRAVSNGTYTLTAHKDNFGDVKKFDIHANGTGKDTVGKIKMYLVPSYSFFELKDSVNIIINSNKDSLHILNGYLRISNPDQINNMPVLIVFGLRKEVEINSDYELAEMKINIPAGYKIYSFSNNIYELIAALNRVQSPVHGPIIYMKVYPLPNASTISFSYDYYDPAKGPQVTSIGKPISGYFVIP